MKLTIVALAQLLIAAAAGAATPSTYRLARTVPLGAPDRWDYVVYDAQTNRVYVAHSDRLDVVDAHAGTLVGSVQGIPGGTHGTAISLATRQGFTDDGENGKVVAFDLRTLKRIREIPANADADGIVLDRLTGHVFVIDGDPATISVIDPRTDAPIATIKAAAKLEAAAGDNRGAVFVAEEGSGDMIKIDARTNRIASRWPTVGCTSPHGVAVDARGHRAFMGCANNVLMVINTISGTTVAKLPIGPGSDTVAFDPVRRRVFSSNGRDGTISVYQQTSADRYVALPPVRTELSARTMAVDPTSGRLFVAGADTTPGATPQARPIVRPGSLRLMIFEPNR